MRRDLKQAQGTHVLVHEAEGSGSAKPAEIFGVASGALHGAAGGRRACGSLPIPIYHSFDRDLCLFTALASASP